MCIIPTASPARCCPMPTPLTKLPEYSSPTSRRTAGNQACRLILHLENGLFIHPPAAARPAEFREREDDGETVRTRLRPPSAPRRLRPHAPSARSVTMCWISRTNSALLRHPAASTHLGNRRRQRAHRRTYRHHARHSRRDAACGRNRDHAAGSRTVFNSADGLHFHPA